MSFDPALFGQEMGELVQRAIGPLKDEIQALRKDLEAANEANADLRRQIDAIPAPENGKDADEAAIEARIKADLVVWQAEVRAGIEVPQLPDIKDMVDSAVTEAVAAIPAPQDGKSVTMEDVEPIIRQAVELAQARVDEAVARIDETVRSATEVIERVNEAVAGLRQPQDGKSVTLDEVAPLISAAVDDLRDRADGVLKEMESATDAAKQAAKEASEKALSLRQPEDGKSVTVEDVRPMIEDQIKRAVDAIPAPKDGVGMAGMLIDRDGNLQATMTNGEVKNLGPVAGKDGLSLESFELDYDAAEHEIIVRASAAGRTKEIRYPAGGIHHRGYWREGYKAKAGESWTHDGSLWIAMKDTGESPSSKSQNWTLAARKGRDGEDGKRVVVQTDPGPIKVGDDGSN